MEAVAKRLSVHIARGRWLGNNNVYRRNCLKAIDTRWSSGATQIDHRHLAEYIVASAPLHCADGWSLLGRALGCHLLRDADAARHLAYYAELRAAMSLLATQAIGVFLRRHFVLASPLQCIEFNGPGTHQVAWLALEHWSGLRRSANLLAQLIQPASLPLADWLNYFQGQPTWRPIGEQWLRTWGLDLRRLSEDLDARNESSYRPTRLNFRCCLEVTTSSTFASSMWMMCEPYESSRFEVLDRYLLRLSLEEAFKATTGRDPSDDIAEFKRRVDRMLRQLNPGLLPMEEWRRFLAREAEPTDPLVIREARGKQTIEHPRHHIQVIARAALLLRVAAGACSRLVQAVPWDRDQLEF